MSQVAAVNDVDTYFVSLSGGSQYLHNTACHIMFESPVKIWEEMEGNLIKEKCLVYAQVEDKRRGRDRYKCLRF
jgi:hypothetical protein